MDPGGFVDREEEVVGVEEAERVSHMREGSLKDLFLKFPRAQRVARRL